MGTSLITRVLCTQTVRKDHATLSTQYEVAVPPPGRSWKVVSSMAPLHVVTAGLLLLLFCLRAVVAVPFVGNTVDDRCPVCFCGPFQTLELLVDVAPDGCPECTCSDDPPLPVVMPPRLDSNQQKQSSTSSEVELCFCWPEEEGGPVEFYEVASEPEAEVEDDEEPAETDRCATGGIKVKVPRMTATVSICSIELRVSNWLFGSQKCHFAFQLTEGWPPPRLEKKTSAVRGKFSRINLQG